MADAPSTSTDPSDDDLHGASGADRQQRARSPVSAARSRPGRRWRPGSSRRTRLERRLASLRTVEWVNVPLLGVLLLWLLPVRRGLAIPGQTWQRTVAYLPVAGLLIAGGWYWHRKLQQVQDGRPIDDAMPMLDRFERVSRWSLRVASVVLVLSWLTWVGATTDRVWATVLLLLAWAEHVNYFRFQLMHDTRPDLRRLLRTRRLRPSRLAADLARWRTVASDHGPVHPTDGTWATTHERPRALRARGETEVESWHRSAAGDVRTPAGRSTARSRTPRRGRRR